MKRTIKYIPFSDLELIFEELEIKKKKHEFFGVTHQQYNNWRKRGRLPSEQFWAFQKEMCVFLDKECLRKKVALGIFDKEYLKELINEE